MLVDTTSIWPTVKRRAAKNPKLRCVFMTILLNFLSLRLCSHSTRHREESFTGSGKGYLGGNSAQQGVNQQTEALKNRLVKLNGALIGAA